MEQQQTTIPEPVTHHYTGEEFDLGETPYMDDLGEIQPYRDVEVATVSSDISAIGDNAFYECKKLHKITIPNNIQTIGKGSFYNCTSLTSISLPASLTTIKGLAFCDCSNLTTISLPASVTTIKENAFRECSNLTNIDIPPSSNLTTIEHVFQECFNLTTISLPASVTTIKELAFGNCSNLTNVNIPPSSNLTTIEQHAFYRCSKLTSISLPASVTKIQRRAFFACQELQMITLPKHATVKNRAFYGCEMLKRSNQADIVTWLKTRFDDLPLHQLCYNINATTTDTSTTQINNQALTTQDALGMTPIHVLILNPFATPNMIKQLVSNNRDAAQVRNVNGKTPLHMYLEKIKCPQSVKDVLLQDGTECDIHDMVEMGLGYEVMDVVLTLSGRRIEAELNNCNEETGFYPFMSAAISHKCKLMDVYKMATENVDNMRRIKTFSNKRGNE